MRLHNTSTPPRATVSRDWVSASEIAEAAYCIRAYHLTRVKQLSPDEVARNRLASGTHAHESYGLQFTMQRVFARIAVTFFKVVLALVLLLVLGVLLVRWKG